MTDWLPVGPPALGVRVGADADVTDGWLVRPLVAADGLDGPADILQGGFASSIGLAVARLADRFGAPLTRLESRLHAPTPLGRELQLALRPGDDVAHHHVQLRDGDTLLVTTDIELAGHDPMPRIGDLTELATVALPRQDPQRIYPSCWVCGQDNAHPHGQAITFGYHGDAVVVPWLADEVLATDGDDRGVVDPIAVSAMLDCPGVWAAIPSLEADGWSGALLGGYELRVYRDAPTYEPLRLVARHDGTDGRKVRVRSALVDEDGVLYAVASALHVAVRAYPTDA